MRLEMENGVPETRGFKFLYGSILNLITLVICLLGANLFSYAVSFIYLVCSRSFFKVQYF